MLNFKLEINCQQEGMINISVCVCTLALLEVCVCLKFYLFDHQGAHDMCVWCLIFLLFYIF